MAGRLADQGYDSAITTDLNGNPDPSADGYCCPQGTRAIDVGGNVECQAFDECYIASAPSTCDFDFEDLSQRNDWIDEEYVSGLLPLDFCVSARADYYAPSDFGPPMKNMSGACCEINKFGGRGYYFDNGDNIQIYG